MNQEHKYIYPAMRSTIKDNGKEIALTVETSLRKEHEGKWYLWKFWKKCVYKNYDELIAHTPIVRDMTHREVYHAIILGKINLQIKDGDGFSIFDLDPNQEPETERLNKLLIK